MQPKLMLLIARRGAGLSQRALAERVGVPQSTVSRIERGRIDPRASTLNRLLLACNLELGLQRRSVDEHGIDRTLIRSQLQRKPRDRLESAAAWADGAELLRSAQRTV
jgi:transcriptional regulator with XRE-family HTH domain